MVFSSMVFLWIFLPVVFIGYRLLDKRFQNAGLLLVSLLFYAWGEPAYILLMLASIFINYLFGLFLDKMDTPLSRKLVLTLAILINLAILCFYKYAGFLVNSVNTIFSLDLPVPNIPLPIGISFFTFQAMSYVIDLYRGEYPVQKNVASLALYISFFPQLIAGPIVKYKDINEQINNRTTSPEMTADGIRRFCYGLGKKVILSNTLAQAADTIFTLPSDGLNSSIAWVGAIFYTLQIYYDFSGYSDMAIGLGKMFGFTFLENFDYPYISASIKEFWRRWHISLSSWFKEYLYIPLGGNRKGTVRTYINLLIVFFTTGLWHGASFNYIFWGLYHGAFQIIERAPFIKKLLEKCKPLGHVYAMFVVIIGWVFFRLENINEAFSYVKCMLLPWKYTDSSYSLSLLVDNRTLVICILGVLGCGFVQAILQKFSKTAPLATKWKNSYVEIIFCGIVLLLCISLLASNTYNPFIYFRF